MAESPEVFAQGTIDTTDEAVYSPTDDVIVKVRIVNPDATEVTGIKIRLTGTGDSAIVAYISSLTQWEQAVAGPYALEGGVDTVRLQSTTGDDLASYTVEGIAFT